MNDDGIAVGYTTQGLEWPTQTMAVVYDVAAPTSTIHVLGMLNAGANFNLSVAYRIDQAGRMIGWSRASNNRDQPVLFSTNGPPIQMGTHTIHTYGAGIGNDGTRFLAPTAPGAFIYNSNYTATAISSQLAAGYFDSCAMNAEGKAVEVTQFYTPTRKQTTIHTLHADGTLTSVPVSALSSTAASYALYVRRMNMQPVIIGERATDGPFYGYAYDVLNDRLYLAPSGGYTFRGLNESNQIVGASLNRAFLGHLVTSNLTVQSVLLDDLLEAEYTGWVLGDAVAINLHGLILAKGSNSALGYGSETYVVLKPQEYQDGYGEDPHATTTHPDAPPVPYSWLDLYGLTNATNPTYNEAVTNDTDGDGQRAWEEYIAGTNPTNADSCFGPDRIAFESEPVPGWVVSWEPITGRAYSVEVAETLSSIWSNTASGIRYPTNTYRKSAINGEAIRLHVGFE